MTPPARFLPLVFLSLSTAFSGAALIASDNFQVGTGFYTAGANLQNQNATGGTTGYLAGSAWVYSTSAVVANAPSTLSNPLVVNPSPASSGGLYLPGVGSGSGTRSQIRQLGSYTTTASDYYMSGLMSSSASFTTGTALFGLSDVTASSALPTAGLQVGFTSGGLISLFHKNAANTYTSTTLLTNYTAGMTYMFVLHLSAATGTVGVDLYNSAGTLVTSVTGIATSTNIGTELTRVNASVTGDFGSGSPSAIRFDEIRYGTELADVLIPEPSAMLLGGLGAVGLLARRRRA